MSEISVNTLKGRDGVVFDLYKQPKGWKGDRAVALGKFTPTMIAEIQKAHTDWPKDTAFYFEKMVESIGIDLAIPDLFRVSFNSDKSDMMQDVISVESTHMEEAPVGYDKIKSVGKMKAALIENDALKQQAVAKEIELSELKAQFAALSKKAKK